MGQSQAILDKIKRNLDMLKIPATRQAASVTLSNSNRVISYVEHDMESPMGGVDGNVTPFLGLGKGSPGKIKLKGAAGENTVAAIVDDAETLRVLGVLGGFANSKLVEAANGTVLAEIEGHVDLLVMGQ
jgi:hypothetical protein